MTVGASNQFDYVDGQLKPTHAALFEQFAAASDRAVEEGRPVPDIVYGPHPRQTLDLFRTPGARRAAVAYFHGGYWQSRDKSGFRFLAPPLMVDGFDVAVVNYPLSPEMRVVDIVAAARASIDCLAALTEQAPMILIGHSAGAQIAVEIGMDDSSTVAGIMAISGVFDLVPLLDTSLNDKLELDAVAARAASPIHRVVSGAPRTVFAVGALETRAFCEQTDSMHRAWADAGNSSAQITVPDKDHFSILSELCRDDGVLRTALSDFA